MGSIKMATIKMEVERIISSHQKYPLLSPATLLYGLSVGYGGMVHLRSRLYGTGLLPRKKLPCPVVSVGNLTAGGTGKTPMTQYLARGFAQFGAKAAIVSRGYGGRAQKSGGVVSDGANLFLGPEDAGDEPYMMAASLPGVPVIVGGDRFAGGISAVERFCPDVILLDDGFQHLRLHRDLDLLLMDGRYPLGNGHILPRGALREPASASARADAIIFTRSDGEIGDLTRIEPFVGNIPRFQSMHRPAIRMRISASNALESEAPESEVVQKPSTKNFPLSGRRIYAFSGIADNHGFRGSLEKEGGNICGFQNFPDHYAYGPSDIREIMERGKSSGAEIFATTEKDYVRIRGKYRWRPELLVMGVDIDFGNDGKPFDAFIRRCISPGTG